MASEDILPVSLTEFTEIELLNFSKAFISFVSQNFRFLKILLREIHALKFIKKAYVSQRAIRST